MAMLKFEEKKVSKLSMGDRVRKYGQIYLLLRRIGYESLTGYGSYQVQVVYREGENDGRTMLWDRVMPPRNDFIALWDWETVEIIKPENIGS